MVKELATSYHLAQDILKYFFFYFFILLSVCINNFNISVLGFN